METRDETVSLISAGKVQGTNVYNTDGDSLGEVYDVMIDKLSGKVAYAIMSFGGFLRVGERYHPLPWNTLKYAPRRLPTQAFRANDGGQFHTPLTPRGCGHEFIDRIDNHQSPEDVRWASPRDRWA